MLAMRRQNFWPDPISIHRSKTAQSESIPVLAGLAIYRQIRDFGLCRGDRDLALAIDRQSPKIRDIEPQKLAISANLSKTWRFWRNT